MTTQYTMNEVTKTTANGSVYATINYEVAGNVWAIMQVSGNFNYVNVRKVTNNPFRGMGKQYDDFNKAAQAYKNPAMKTALLMAEIELNANK